MVSPRRFSSGQHPREGTAWPTTPLQPFANARLLLNENAIPGDTSSTVLASHVLECFLERDNYISAKENGPGVDTGDFTYQGYICRAARLHAGPQPPNPGAIWLSSELVWQQSGRRVTADGANPTGANPSGLTTVVAPYGSGGIGALVQPLIGERVFGTLKPNRLT